MSSESRTSHRSGRRHLSRQSQNHDDREIETSRPDSNDVQKILSWTSDVDEKLKDLSMKLDAVTSLQKPVPEQGSTDPSQKTSSTLIPLKEIANTYDRQVERLRLENKKLHGHIQESLKSKDKFRDDVLGPKFEYLKRQIEQVYRNHCRPRDKRPSLEWKAMARLTDNIHDAIFDQPHFALQCRSHENSLVEFERNLLDNLGYDPSISEWRSATLHLAEESGLIADLKGSTFNFEQFSRAAAEELRDLVDFDEQKFHSALIGLSKTAFDLNMMLRGSRHMYLWDQKDRSNLPSVNWIDYPNYFDPDSNGQYRERVLFGPLLKLVDGNWSVVKNGHRLVAREE